MATVNNDIDNSDDMNACSVKKENDPSSHICHKYSIHSLLLLRNSPFSRQRPSYIDQFRSRGFYKQTDLANEELNTGLASRPINQESNSKRRGISTNNSSGNASDPRDRLRKENGIILSPQRKSFNMGCQMPSAPNSQVHPSISRIERVERETNNRVRIGSGRILNRDVSWDYKPTDNEVPDVEFNYRNNAGISTTRDSKERDYERRFDREKDARRILNSRYSSNNYGNSNYDRYRMQSDNRDDEPEWFSSGPTSQNDTIELRGFDDPKTDDNKNDELFDNDDNCGVTITNKKNSNISTESAQSVSKSSSSTIKTNSSLMKNLSLNDSNNNTKREAIPDTIELKESNNDNDFNFEDFLKMDNISELLPVS